MSELDYADRYDESAGRTCPYCRGLGRHSVDGGSLSYRCVDCDGTGRLYPPDEDEDIMDESEGE